MKKPEEFKIPRAEFPDESKIIERLLRVQETILAESRGGDSVRYALPPNFLKALADIATNVWKAKAKMLDSSGAARSEKFSAPRR